MSPASDRLSENGADVPAVPPDRPADGAFAAVARQVLEQHPGDEPGRMLHSPGLRTAGRFYAFAPAADLMVKLPAVRVTELVGTGRGLPCETRPGRPMREWVRIPAPAEGDCLALVLEARTFVTSRTV